MNGLIVKQPFAGLIIEGSKTWELRSRSPPNEKLNQELYLLSSGSVLGKIKIIDNWITSKKELKQNKEKHWSDTQYLSDYEHQEVWEIEVTEKFQKPKKYFHPIGARIWVNNVSFRAQPLLVNFV